MNTTADGDDDGAAGLVERIHVSSLCINMLHAKTHVCTGILHLHVIYIYIQDFGHIEQRSQIFGLNAIHLRSSSQVHIERMN